MYVDEFVQKFENPKPGRNGQYMVRCPCHEDKKNSLVYTEGFALMGLTEVHRILGDGASLEAAKKLGAFLMRIQCQGESHLWDGAWRGSYNVAKDCWAGRADQNNPIDEGGMYSVYTGWCNAPILYGLLRLEALLEE